MELFCRSVFLPDGDPVKLFSVIQHIFSSSLSSCPHLGSRRIPGLTSPRLRSPSPTFPLSPTALKTSLSSESSGVSSRKSSSDNLLLDGKKTTYQAVTIDRTKHMSFVVSLYIQFWRSIWVIRTSKPSWSGPYFTSSLCSRKQTCLSFSSLAR